jgi:hypothetical protein
MNDFAFICASGWIFLKHYRYKGNMKVDHKEIDTQVTSLILLVHQGRGDV